VSSRWHNSGNGKKRAEPTSKYKKQLKREVFERDGWCEVIETEIGPRKIWFAYCAFDCGIILWMETATLDHYPIPYRINGTWELDNLRLACHRCNTIAGGDAGPLAKLMPVGLTNLEKIKWHREYEMEKIRLISMHGIPLIYL
jgi:5-methylcytosine-specific restriction endonuclease McrA